MKPQKAIIFLSFALGLLGCTNELPMGRQVELQLPTQPYQYNTGTYLPTLGRVLFYDRQLSINNSISCGSCHKQELAFADNVRFSSGFESKLTGRNSMPIQNLGFGGVAFVGGNGVTDFSGVSSSLFWDGREKNLNAMVLMPLVNHVEMGVNDIGAFTKKVAGIPYYKDLFAKAYGNSEVNTDKISRALAAFVQSIRTNQTKFDKFQSTSGFSSSTGNPAFQGVLSPAELDGWKLFNEKYNCNSCHQVQSPNGYVMAGEFANIGLDKEYDDNGVQAVSNMPGDAGKFRIPSLRNVALTAPYMHDGRFETLEEVIDHYKDGIKDHPNLDFRLRNADHSPRSIPITPAETQSIVAFLRTLTDQAMIADRKFSNPFVVK